MPNIELGKRIKSIREKLGKSQAEFGQMFEPPAPKSAVSRWEHGGSPNKKRLAKIAELGGIPVEVLINGDLLHAVDNMYKFLYDEYWNYQDYMKDDNHDARSYIADMAENSTLSRINYQLMAEFFSYIWLIAMSGNIEQAFNVCAREVYEEAKARNVKSTAKGLLLRMFTDTAKRKAFNLERTNKGLINTLNEGVKELSSNVHSLYFGVNEDKLGGNTNNVDVVLPNSIDKDLFNDAEKLLEETKQKIKNLSNQYKI